MVVFDQFFLYLASFISISPHIILFHLAHFHSLRYGWLECSLNISTAPGCKRFEFIMIYPCSCDSHYRTTTCIMARFMTAKHLSICDRFLLILYFSECLWSQLMISCGFFHCSIVSPGLGTTISLCQRNVVVLRFQGPPDYHVVTPLLSRFSDKVVLVSIRIWPL